LTAKIVEKKSPCRRRPRFSEQGLYIIVAAAQASASWSKLKYMRVFFRKIVKQLGLWMIGSGIVILVGGVLPLSAQEPDAGRPQGPGARRDARGSTREFLGLGAAPDPVAAQKGEPLFKQNCATCHGEKARGAQGPNLVRSVVVLHDEKDEEIGPVIKNGRPQGGMPPFPQLSQDDIHNIAQYIKLQVELAANRGTYGQTYAGQKNEVSGDVKEGQKFFEANCVACHSATGDMAKIGAKFPQASVMQSRFIWPASRGPAQATVTTPSGEVVTGSVVKLDDFDVAIRDSKGEYRYWPISEVKVQVTDKLQGHRSLLAKYTDADLHNITAYLETLK
jgi:cytochrome c oxidase cbb3-type subunit III